MKRKAGSLMLLVMLTICGCINLDHVNTFSKESMDALANQSDIGYSFYQYCLDFDCQPDIQPLDENVVLQDNTCDCSTMLAADKTIAVFNKILYGYLDAMSKLSDGKLINYNYQDLARSINADAVRGKLNISSDQINSASKLATDITNKLMDAFRKKKLAEVIVSTNDDFQKVMDAYISFISDGIRDQVIENALANLKNKYSGILKINRKILTPEGREKVLKEYQSKKNALEKSKQLATKYIESLKAIKAGHQTIAEEASNISEEAVIKMIMKAATEIKTLREEFLDIKKTKTSN